MFTVEDIFNAYYEDVPFQIEKIPHREDIRSWVVGQVQSVLGVHFYDLDTFEKLNFEKKDKIFKILAFNICNSDLEFEIFWESLASGNLACVINGETVHFNTPIYSGENYKNLLEALYFYEYRNVMKLKSKNLH